MVRVRIGDELHELTWEEWEARVRSGRIPDDAEVQFEAVTGSDFVVASDLEMYRSLRDDAAIAWRGRFLAGPPPLLTALLIGIQVRIWWFAQVPEIQGRWVHRLTNWTSPTLEDAEIWRPLTMGILHTHPLHIVLNMLWLAYCGWNLERALGRANLLALYVASVLGGSILSMFGSPASQSLGASGGVYGLVAASVAFGFARPELLPQRGRRLFGAAMLPYLIVMFWSGLMSEDTDNWSHLGGLLTGGLLALVLDPEPLQRRPGWNRSTHALIYGAIGAILATLALAGPRITPVIDSEASRLSFLPARRQPTVPPDPDRYRSLRWATPEGWRPAGPAIAIAGFASPAGGGTIRSFGVRERADDALWTHEDLGQAWVEAVRGDWPDAEVEPAVPASISGFDGLHRVAHIGPAAAPRVVEWWGVARGSWLLEVEWEVDVARRNHLTPLRDRLLARVRWTDPELLEEARQAVAYLPNSVKARLALARELSRIGELPAAFALHDAVLEDAPNDPKAWAGALDTVALATGRINDAESWWQRALTTQGTPAVVVAVVDGLERSGREADALGLLRVAWDETPGDRSLRRARRSRGLSTELDSATGAPWDLITDPVTGSQRSESSIRVRQHRSLALGAAVEAGQELRAEQAAIEAAAVDAIRRGDPGGVLTLLVLKDGFIPDADTDAVTALLDDLDRLASEGVAARWMPAPVEAALRASTEFAEAAASAQPPR